MKYKHMNVREFEQYISVYNPKVIIFSSENNINQKPLLFNLAFDKFVFLFSNPNLMILKGDCGQIVINNITDIAVSQIGMKLGIAILIKCKKYNLMVDNDNTVTCKNDIITYELIINNLSED